MTKQCKECNQELPIEVFPSAGKVKGVQYYKSYCRVCSNIKARKWKLNNIEQWKEYMSRYSPEWTAENRERLLEYWRAYNKKYLATQK